MMMTFVIVKYNSRKLPVIRIELSAVFLTFLTDPSSEHYSAILVPVDSE